MTIKELEERTGLARANIRYYESEGLITPKRLDNGYRDYSEEDAVTLEKIRLLRELHLDIDTIRLVQKGDLTLEQALFSHLSRLEGEKAAIGRAVEVCRELERSGVEYGALEPKPWLDQLEAPRYPRIVEPARPVSQVIEDRTDYAWNHPWMRWLARIVDTALHSLPVLAVLMLGFDWNPVNASALGEWLVGVLCLAVTLLCEPFWLHFWGWTPGKWIFGLKVRGGRGGRKLTLGEGFWRAGGVFIAGYGANLPGANLYCYWRFWKTCAREGPASWDGETTYTYEERRLDWLMCLGAGAALIGLMVLLVFQAYLPPNRGALTEREYYENINFYLNWMTESQWRLSDEGQWLRMESGDPFAWHDCPEIYVELGTEGIGSVTLIADDTERWGGVIYQDVSIYQFALLSLLAQEKISTGEYNDWTALFEGQWGDFETEREGVRIVQTVEFSGYTGIGQILPPGEGVAQSYTKTVTITLIGSE